MVLELDPDELDVVRQVGDELVCRCHMHDDRSPSLYANIRKDVWICFACNVSGVLRKATPVQRKPVEEHYPDMPIISSKLSSSYMRKRGFDEHTILAWGISQKQQAVYIPMPVGDHWEYIRRNLIGQPKYVNPEHVQKSGVLFGSHMINGSASTVVAEGPLDCIWLWQCGFNAVALLGSHLSNQQRAMLEDYQELYLCFDNDAAGQQATETVASRVRTHIRICHIPKRYKDIQECSPALVEQIIKAASNKLEDKLTSSQPLAWGKLRIKKHTKNTGGRDASL